MQSQNWSFRNLSCCCWSIPVRWSGNCQRYLFRYWKWKQMYCLKFPVRRSSNSQPPYPYSSGKLRQSWLQS